MLDSIGIRRVVGLVVSALLATLLAACSSAPTPMPKQLSGTAEGWKDADAVIRVATPSSTGPDGNSTVPGIPLAEGTLSAEGAFVVTLPVLEASSEAFVVPDFACNEGQRGSVSVVPDTLKIARAANLEVFSGSGMGEVIGGLYQYAPEPRTERGFYSVNLSYLYASGSGTISGTCIYEDSGLKETIVFDLELEPGWNTVILTHILKINPDDFKVIDELFQIGSIPSGTRWYYSAATPPPAEPE